MREGVQREREKGTTASWEGAGWEGARRWGYGAIRGQGSLGLGRCDHLGGQSVNEAKTGLDQWQRVTDFVTH